MFAVEALLLAAGESKRFDGAKQLALIDGSPMIIHVLRAFEQAEFSSITLVLGGHFSKVSKIVNAHSLERQAQEREIEENIESVNTAKTSIRKKVNKPSTKTLEAKLWAQGMGASIAQGVQHIDNNISHVFVGLADQIAVRTKHCNLLIDASRANPSKIVAAFYNGKLGAPAIFPRRYFSELAALNDDKGARDILRANEQGIIAVEMPEAAIDIDTKQDLLTYALHNEKFK